MSASAQSQPAQQQVPLAPQVKGSRPRANPAVLAPAATQLLPEVKDLAAPNRLALPTKPAQVQISELRPLGLLEAENLAEVNNPNLKAVSYTNLTLPTNFPVAHIVGDVC